MTEPARSFQHYEVLRRDDGTPWELGRGAMGITYKAFDVNLCCEVALKVVSSALVEHPDARERFVREARAAAALRHRNVASVYHLGNDGEHFFYAMEFINGDTLDALVRRGGPLSVEDTLRVALQVARALAAAERQHLVHRDIKPANLMVTHEDADEETVVKVIDFGLARAAATAQDAPPLTIGGFVGTPQYASPEQLEERPLDARSDIYSLGVTAWFLLTGRVPFTGSLATICQQQLTHPPPWEQLPVSVPTCVRGLLGHLLAKDPARRPQNAAALRSEIETCLEKVRGADRQRPLHLPALPPVPAPRETGKGRVAPREVQTGTLLNRRYRLLRDIGGRDGVRVYQARDDAGGDKAVAVKILPDTVTPGPAERGLMAEQVRLVQAAAHPGLVRVLALERSASPAAVFLVEEWLAGFTARDLLAGRSGALPVTEALRLLEQAASAVDHAARCRLEPLDLALSELHLSFPALEADDGSRGRTFLAKSMPEWPEWTLKIHAFHPRHDPLALDTWAGGATLLPTSRRTHVPPGNVADPDVPSLAKLVYELLGGTPVVHTPRADVKATRYGSLPVLNEEANALLRQTLAGEGTLSAGWQFYQALVETIGREPVRGDARVPVARAEFLPKTESVETPATPGGPAFTGERAHESTWNSRAVPAGKESVAPFFQEADGPNGNDPEEAVAGSAWDRLTLVTGKRAHPGRWLAAILGLAAVFVLGFVGVLAWLFEQTPARAAAAPPVRKPLAEPVSHRATPVPLVANSTASASLMGGVTRPVETPAVAAGTPAAPSPPPVVRVENAPPAPLAAETPAAPTVAPTREHQPMVRLDSVPQGAQIRLGNEVLGTTPFRVRLPAGTHQLVARYQDWPETRHTIHLDGTEVRTSVEIRLMRPDLIPGLAASTPAAAESHARRIPAPAARPVPPADDPSPPAVRATPDQPMFAPSAPSEPEVRPAQRVLTPFKADDPAGSSPSPTANRQPFSADDSDDNH